jgi:excisionase family DNA binding protein
MAKGKNVLTTGDVAKICNVAPRTVSKWFDNGQLKGYRIPGSKDRRIPVSELIRFMKDNNIPATSLPVGKIRVLIVDSSEDRSSVLAKDLAARGNYKGIDAKDICSTIRSDKELETIKIIAVGPQLNDSESAALLRNGFDGSISNSADISEVIKKIEETTAIVY